MKCSCLTYHRKFGGFQQIKYIKFKSAPIFALLQIKNKTMKQLLILSIITIFSVTGLQAQSATEVTKTTNEVTINTTVEVTNVITVKIVDEKVAAKKKDILNAKIDSKLKGQVDLFFVADKNKTC